jgi:hypothetical protein
MSVTRLDELERLKKEYVNTTEIEKMEQSKLTPLISKQRRQQIVAKMGAQMGDQGTVQV